MARFRSFNQDWELVIVHKKAPQVAKKDEKVVRQCLVDVEMQFCKVEDGGGEAL